MNCLECNNNTISHWCLDEFCEKPLICDQCQIRHGNVEKIFRQNATNTKKQQYKINAWVRKVMKQLLLILDKIYDYQQQTEQIFQQEENEQNRNEQNRNEQNRKDTLKKQLRYYKGYQQFQQEINSLLINFNNQINNCHTKLQQNIVIENNDTIQISNCKKQIQEFHYNQQSINDLNPKESKYFEIECLIIQNNLKDAFTLSKETIKKIENLDPDFLIQQAKILHKQKQYQSALKVLEQLKDKNNNNNNWILRFQLQFAKTSMKCGYLELGYNQILNIKNSVADQNNIDQLNEHFLEDYSFSLAYAKASLKMLDVVRLNVDTSNLDNGQGEQIIKELYKGILTKDPNNQKALFGLSQLYIKQKYYQDARDILYQLIQLNPSYYKAQVGLFYLKERLLEIQQDEIEDQFSTIEGCFGFLVNILTK